MDEKNNSKKTRWVLSIDGGGVRGLFSSILITKIEKQLGFSCCQLFDLVVGVSVGGLIAMSIGQEKICSTKESLTSLFKRENLKRIFNKSCWDKIMPLQIEPKYDGKGKKEVLKEHLLTKHFGDVSTNIAVLAFDIYNEKPRTFKSWDEEDYYLNPCEIADATSAAPTYFPCTEVNNTWFVDGGVFANNPCLVALQEAQALWGKDADIRILSVGTGHNRSHHIDGDEAEDWGLPRWLYYGLVDILMDAPMDAMYNYCKFTLPKGNFLRLDGIVNGEKIDDTSEEYRKSLEVSAKSVYKENKQNIADFFNDFSLDAHDIQLCENKSTTYFKPNNPKKPKCELL